MRRPKPDTASEVRQIERLSQMPYSEELEARINALLMGWEGNLYKEIHTKRMFGGLAFLFRGKMSVGIIGDSLTVRIPGADMEKALLRPGARPMDFTGRAMKEFVFVDPLGYTADEDLRRWIQWGLDHARAKLGVN